MRSDSPSKEADCLGGQVRERKCLGDDAQASLKDLGKNTFFFTQEDFSLEEVLKESRKIQEEMDENTNRGF